MNSLSSLLVTFYNYYDRVYVVSLFGAQPKVKKSIHKKIRSLDNRSAFFLVVLFLPRFDRLRYSLQEHNRSVVVLVRRIMYYRGLSDSLLDYIASSLVVLEDLYYRMVPF
jgi:hypothetical protein